MRQTSTPVNEYLCLMSAGEKLETIASRYGVKLNAVAMALKRAGLPASLRQFDAWVAAGNVPPLPFYGPPKARVCAPRGPKPLTLTLAMIHSRCEEEGDCLLWTGAMTTHAGPGSPSARHEKKTVNVRRLVWQLTHPDAVLAPEVLVTPSCRNERCLNPHHLLRRTRAAHAKALAPEGTYSRPEANLRRIAGARAAAPKLTMELARAIRASDEPPKVWAERLGVSRSLVGQVRQNLLWAEVSPSVPVNSVFALGLAA